MITINIFGDATRIARVLGLDVDLPDCENTDPDYWEAVHAGEGYKSRIADRIADPWIHGDRDWVKLLQLSWGEIWHDLEEGIKVFLMSRDIGEAVSLLARLRQEGIPLAGDGYESLVWIIPQFIDGDTLLRVRRKLEAAGLKQGFKETVWTVP
jgi:hypothetical protein